ncbi:cysteine-rich motor neuron 1 protein [Apis cerana cerana]|uniref:Cysteine-rich motor neuron 1 protein n=1 Tax=Apis cerana cerana TaxID=94128 RepID=A0A2A3ENQ9_APICC|nr:cysteine-rich motor neuron 1 protein [Apis cerana cerana]
MDNSWFVVESRCSSMEVHMDCGRMYATHRISGSVVFSDINSSLCRNTKIPGRWRRHCPHGQIMSEPGCNLVSEGTAGENGNTVSTGKCVCGPSVPWCPNEPRPYDYSTRHECKLNLAAKMNYGWWTIDINN